MNIHPNYLSSKQIISSKTGQHYNYYNSDGSTQKRLIDLGYKYYYKNNLGYFGKNILLKVISTRVIQGQLYCLCKNTINFEYLILAKDLIINDD